MIKTVFYVTKEDAKPTDDQILNSYKICEIEGLLHDVRTHSTKTYVFNSKEGKNNQMTVLKWWDLVSRNGITRTIHLGYE